MKNQDSTLAAARHALCEKMDLGCALRILRQYVSTGAAPSISERLEAIEDNYRRMCDYMLQGLDDPHRSDVYGALLRQTYGICQDAQLQLALSTNQTYMAMASSARDVDNQADAIRRHLEAFGVDLAMLSLQSEDERHDRLKEIYREHNNYIGKLFAHLLVSQQWSDATRNFYTSLLMLPTVDTIDSLTLVSAITLSCSQLFDVNKWLCQCDIAMKASDEALRQRALAGMLLTLPMEERELFPQVSGRLRGLSSDLKRTLLETQMQMFYCKTVDDDNYTIQHDIIPDIMKNNNFNIGRNGLLEQTEDTLQEILDPGASDKAMQRVEESFKRMADMQRKGADIYFGGFSHMKRFPFFYQLSNWFVPFYKQHPALEKAMEKLGNLHFMDVLMKHGPFCESDKYSFALSMVTVVDRMSPAMREMMGSAEVLGVNGESIENVKSPAYIRRMYLMDLFRFFRLYHNKNDFENPFATSNGNDKPSRNDRTFFFVNSVVPHEELQGQSIELLKFLFKRRMFSEMSAIFKRYPSSSSSEKEQSMKLEALMHIRQGEFDVAISALDRLLQINPYDEQTLKSYAQACFHVGKFRVAAETYGKLIAINPENISYAVNKAISQINVPLTQQESTKRAGESSTAKDKTQGKDDEELLDEGMQTLYRLDYERQNDFVIKRALAWGLLLQQKLEGAERVYNQLLMSERSENTDKLNMGYTLWFERKIVDAVSMLRHYTMEEKKLNASFTIAKAFCEDALLLQLYGIDRTEQNIMISLIESNPRK